MVSYCDNGQHMGIRLNCQSVLQRIATIQYRDQISRSRAKMGRISELAQHIVEAVLIGDSEPDECRPGWIDAVGLIGKDVALQ